MRQIQMKVVCDNCGVFAFYDMPIRFAAEMLPLLCDDRNIGPDNWEMTFDKCWCPECKYQHP